MARTRLGEQQRDFAEQVAFFQNRERLRSSAQQSNRNRPCADVNTVAHAVPRRRTSTLASLGFSRGSTVAWRTVACRTSAVSNFAVSVTFAGAAQEARRNGFSQRHRVCTHTRTCWHAHAQTRTCWHAHTHTRKVAKLSGRTTAVHGHRCSIFGVLHSMHTMHYSAGRALRSIATRPDETTKNAVG